MPVRGGKIAPTSYGYIRGAKYGIEESPRVVKEKRVDTAPHGYIYTLKLEHTDNTHATRFGSTCDGLHGTADTMDNGTSRHIVDPLCESQKVERIARTVDKKCQNNWRK